uniref:retinoblastoma-like protein 2 n=1 Tax=Monopterus albus TaxID=43700 RepID=UPI0009B2EAC5|nr:retinoblastoma-like protein 2 [Monopterus albus]
MATDPESSPGKPRFGPSDRLIAMFRACIRDPTEAIKARLRHMLHTFLQHIRDNAENEKTKELAVKCCCKAEVWYYRILEDLVSREGKSQGVSGISGILENDLLQCCLVVCCLEITIYSSCLRCDLPLLLHLFKLPAYDFWKVTELVLWIEVTLHHSDARHLTQVKEKVLESLAWTSNSSLWEEIRANEGHLPTCQQVMPPTQLEDPQRTELHPDGSLPGVGGSLGADSTDHQCSPSAGNRPRSSSFLHVFARKVYSLMGKRLRELCSIMGISDELRLKIWTCFEYSLVYCNYLMVGHHLDQLLMCAIYIIAKITEREIPFKHIMKCYKSLPHAKKSVSITKINKDNGDRSDLTPSTPSKHYPGSCREERSNLIYFYNEVYMKKMRDFAGQLASTSGADTPPLSPYPQEQRASPRRRQVSSSHPIFISLLDPETTSPCKTSLSYYFSSSPPERLREINNMVRTGWSPNRPCPAMSPDRGEEAGDDGPSAKRLRMADQSAWQRRLRNVVSDRVTRRNQDQYQSSPVTKPNLP